MSKPKPKSSPTKPSTKTPPTPPTPPPSLAAAYNLMLPAAMQLPPERVLPCRADVNLIYANVQKGLGAVLPQLGRLRVETPKLEVNRFPQLEDLAGALLYAAAQTAASAAPMKRELLDQKLTRLYTLREPMLLCAEVFALLGMLPKQRVEQIRSGSGPFDAAQDGVALADLFAEFASVVKDKHPFTQEQFTEIAELGHAILRSVTPDGARVALSPELVKATEARDRLYSLLMERYDELQRAGYYLFGSKADEKVPALGSRKGRSRSDAKSTEPTPPTPTPDPAPAAPPS